MPSLRSLDIVLLAMKDPRTLAQLKADYPGCDCSFIVGGSYGELHLSSGMSEADAIREYERPERWFAERRRGKPRALYVICRLTSWEEFAGYEKGWIDETKLVWDPDLDSLRVLKVAKLEKL